MPQQSLAESCSCDNHQITLADRTSELFSDLQEHPEINLNVVYFAIIILTAFLVQEFFSRVHCMQSGIVQNS